METNKKQIYNFIKLHSKATQNSGVSTQYLADKLGILRSNASSILNALVEEGLLKKLGGRPVLYGLSEGDNDSDARCFESLIGYNGSLERSIRLAKAAVLYPQKCLDILIAGEQGTGKNLFARTVHQYAESSGILKKEAPFIKVDCKKYQDNEIRLIESIFGDGNKGTDNENYYKSAAGGILHIDHAHLLGAEIRSRLCSTIEQNQNVGFEPLIRAEPMIIITCETVNPAALKDFAKIIPFTAELPSLAERPLKERMELIQNILTTEAARAKRTLTIPAELLRCLLLYDCLSYNIIQLKADLRRGCAMAYLRERGSGDENLNLYISDFEHHIRKGFLNYEKHRKETEEIIPLDYHYTFSASAMEMSTKSRRQYRGFYDEIDKKAGELMERGINADEINLFLSTELEATYRQFWNESVSQQINKEQLINLVNKDVIEPVEAFLNDASAKLSRDFSPSVFYGLCLHIDNAIKGNVSKQLMSVPQMSAIVEKYKLEYSLSLLFITGIEKIFSIKLPIDETVLITLFLLSDDPRVGTVKRPVILFALHGNGVAASLANMINSIANFDNTFFCEIPFAQEHTKTYENLQKHIKNIDRGKGVAVIYDMDFLAPMLNTAAGEIGIEIRTIKLPITLSGIEWSRRAAIVSDVDTLSQSINTTINGYKKSPKKIIVTLCTTGEGGALQLKKYIMKYGDMKDIDIVPLAMANGELLRNKLTELQDEYLIYCIVGTFDPMLFGIPYIPVSDVLGVSPKMLPEILRFKKQEKSRIDLDEVFAYLKEQLLNIDVKKLRNLLPPIIEEFNEKITPMSIDTEVGLLIHMACSINRLAGNLSLPVNIRKEAIIKAYDTHYKQIRKLVKPLEKAFKTIITDDELANIIMIVNKL